MPIIQIDMLEGRDLEKKRLLAKKVTDAVCESLGCGPEAVRIIMREMKFEHLSRGGKLACDE